jgi:MFS family permease
VAAASQYGTVAFLPAFAVSAWGLAPATAALLLGAARVLSVPAKLISGGSADQAGALRVARRLGLSLAVLGVWWTVVPNPAAAAWASVLFAAFVSGLGPLANLLAFEGFGRRGALVGVFRSAQVGLAAATSAAIGGLSSGVGLRPALALASALPAVLLVVRRAPAVRAGEPGGDRPGPGPTPG